MKGIAIFATLIGLAVAKPQVGPGHGHAAGYGHDAPAHYNYAYNVVDSYAGLNFGQSEGRDGYATKGEYHVQLPDGRLQTVVYHVDDEYSGYVADVSYSGEPHYGPVAHGPVGHGPVGHGPVGHGPVGHGPVGHGPVGHGPVGHGPIGHGPIGHGPAGFGLGGPIF